MYTTGPFITETEEKPGVYTKISKTTPVTGYSSIGVVSIMATIKYSTPNIENGVIRVTKDTMAQALNEVYFDNDDEIKAIISEILVHSHTVLVCCVQTYSKTASTITKRYGDIIQDGVKIGTIEEKSNYNYSESNPPGFMIRFDPGKTGSGSPIGVSVVNMDKVAATTLGTPAVDPTSNTTTYELKIKFDGSTDIVFTITIDSGSDLKTKPAHAIVGGVSPAVSKDANSKGYAYAFDIGPSANPIKCVYERTGGYNKDTGYFYIHIHTDARGAGQVEFHNLDTKPVFKDQVVKSAPVSADMKLHDVLSRLSIKDLKMTGESSFTISRTASTEIVIPLMHGFEPLGYEDRVANVFVPQMTQSPSAIAYLHEWGDGLSDTDKTSDAALKTRCRAIQATVAKHIIKNDLPTQLLMDEDRYLVIPDTTGSIGWNHPCIINMQLSDPGDFKSDDSGGKSVKVGAWSAGLLAGCGYTSSAMARIYDGSIQNYITKTTQDRVEKSLNRGTFVFHREINQTMVYVDRSSYKSAIEIPSDWERNSHQYTDAFKRNHTVRVINAIKDQVRSIFFTRYIGQPLDHVTLASLETDVVTVLSDMATSRAIEYPSTNDVKATKVSSTSVKIECKIELIQLAEILYFVLEV
jgi:hypothetical protein